MSDVKNKIVLITGGSLGIGKCMAKKFAMNNARVIICSRNQQDLDDAAAEISAVGSCEGMAVDVSRPDKAKQLIDYVRKKHGRLDVLINCAGIYGPIGPLETTDAVLWEQAIKINLIGTMNCIRHAIPVMKQQGSGKIINMAGGGVGGTNIQPNFSAYIASKAAISGFTEAMARELKDFNIQVNAISPGSVNTRLLDQVLKAGESSGSEFLEKSRKQKTDGGTSPEKAAALALFLAGDDSNFVTGKTLSAVWDDYSHFHEIRQRLDSSLYNLRRIDDLMFKEIA